MVLLKVYPNILKPLCKNEFSIENTQSFPKKTREFPPLESEEEDVSYDVDSLFTKLPLKETLNYILDQIYVHKIPPQICSSLFFKRLLMKLATEVTFTFNNKFCKQINGCTICDTE